MTDAHQPDRDAAGGQDPWAPPESRPSLDKDRDAATGRPPAAGGPPGQQPPSVHDQATVTSMPAAGYPPPPAASATPPGGTAPQADPFAAPGAAVPPPPVAPGGPAPHGGSTGSGYGYPGYPQSYGWPGGPMGPQPQNGMGIAAMVLGILACCLFCFYGVVSVVLGILAIVFGVKGRRRAERGEATNHGQAQAGLVMGVIGLVLGIAVLVLLAVGITAAINSDSDSYDDPYYGAGAPAAVSVAANR
ncbi:DUF4190 domain-containing protein [Streptomyces sp. SW4]|nr:DUF4190 domain-containing protein [Streptomyces sp. SW4]